MQGLVGGCSFESTEVPILRVLYRMHEEYELEFLDGLKEEDDPPMWETERIELKSVGIDIKRSVSKRF